MNVQTTQRLKLKIQPLDGNDCDCLFGANGDPIEILGTVSVDVNINGLKMPTTFQILKNLSHSIILGIEFLEQNKAVIDTHRGIVTFHDITGTPFIRRRPDNTAFVRAARSITIPPLTEAIVDVTIDRHYSLKHPSIIEPVERLIDKKVMLAKCIVTPKSHVLQCRMLNPTSASVFFKRNYIFGTIEPLGDQCHDINVIDSQQSPGSSQIHSEKTKITSPEEILKELHLEIDKTKFSKSDYIKLVQFLAKNKDLFATKLSDVPGTDVIEHKIEVTSEKPIRLRAYRTTPAARAEIERQLDEMLEQGVISESDSPWSAPVLLVKKANGDQRLVVDFRQVNQVTVDKFQSLPTMDEIFDCMAENHPTIFSSLDLFSGYLQIPMEQSSKKYTGFTTSQQNHFEYNFMPYGMKGAPFTFIALMQKILRGINYRLYSVLHG